MTRWITPRRRGVGKAVVEAVAEGNAGGVVAGFSVEVFI